MSTTTFQSASPGLTHQGLIYGHDEEFLAAMVPFVLDGLAQDDAIFAVTTPANIDLLRQALGDESRQVDFIDAETWYWTPGRTLGAYYRYVDQRTGSGGPHHQVRVIGEPVWHGRNPMETAEWTRYEAAINLAFAACPAWIVCPYDNRVLPEEVVADARRTHPQLVTDASVGVSAGYAPPDAGNGPWRCELTPSSAALGTEPSMTFGADLDVLRTFLADAAEPLGMSEDALARLVFAVNEVATNAVQHAGEGRVALRREGRRVVCDVVNVGSAEIDWYVGYLPPVAASRRGHGLWTVRQLCELVEIDHGDGVTTVRLHLSLD